MKNHDTEICETCCNPDYDCICPPCPVCGVTGDPACYWHHGLKYSNLQYLGQSSNRIKRLQELLDTERRIIAKIAESIHQEIAARDLEDARAIDALAKGPLDEAEGDKYSAEFEAEAHKRWEDTNR